ncbi:MAG: hypothetical protein NTY20_01485 [Candidatus Aenigmarchaeota archaeon]|nr:hypothetical protein [Candidatus Aenigmarchaeota archaeon]
MEIGIKRTAYKTKKEYFGMAYDVLNRLKADGMLRHCSIVVSDKNALRKHKTLFGRDISGFTRLCIQFRGGETHQEILSVPMESVQEIRLGKKAVFAKKKRIERIYPR